MSPDANRMDVPRRAGTGVATLALLVGVLAVQWCPLLPPPWASAAAAIATACAILRFPRHAIAGIVLFGAALAAWHGERGMQARLDRSLEGSDMIVTGTVDELPRGSVEASSFVLRIERLTLDGKPVPLRGRARIAWYRGDAMPEPCSRWQLAVRLKRPRGLINPGGADTERAALERGIVATGYVRPGPGNRPLDGARWCVDRLRAAISREIAARVVDPHDARLLRALAVGDTRALDRDDWEVARANGIAHLIAISGFHVGLAAIFGAWLTGGLWRLAPLWGLRMPRVVAQALAALAWAAAYSALAGFGLPTVRTLAMIAIVTLARCSRRRGGGAPSLALAMIAILLCDPLAVLSAGFWLSFAGVALLMLCLASTSSGWRGFLRELVAAQLLMTLALMPLTLWFFGRASLVGALSNLVAAPFVSFLVVPTTLLGCLLLAVAPPLATPVLRLAGWMMHGQWWLLERMAGWPGAHWHVPAVDAWALALASLGALWLFMPRGVPLRLLGLLLFVPLVWPQRDGVAHGGFQATVLDVGQGLSVLVRTEKHALLYDAGARFASGFDLGEAVVVPSLHALGVDRLDLLMISHGDNDHAGGAAAVFAAFPEAHRYSGEPDKLPFPAIPCAGMDEWQWDGVVFRLLYPAADGPPAKGNDSSCVLAVEGSGGRLLLTGDIGARIEARIATSLVSDLPTALVVPHHGSRHSSSTAFVDAVAPALAVFSAGWRSRFGHPHPQTVERYRTAGAKVRNTAEEGALSITVDADGTPWRVDGYRPRARRYWREGTAPERNGSGR
jgi:competence protein ComEC